MIPDSLKQSVKTDTALRGSARPKTEGRNSPGAQPVAIIFNDKEQSEDNNDTYNVGGTAARSAAKNDSMLFSSALGKDGGADSSTFTSNCIMSLCGP